MLHKLILYSAAALLSATIACSQAEVIPKVLVSIPAGSSNLRFENTITESADLNIFGFHYLYNGGGVGIGDFNNDGLADAVLTGNQVPSSLYINQGGLKFSQVSKQANFLPVGWITGVTIVDINSDGRDDIYLSVGGVGCNGDCHNLLYINESQNNNVPTFREAANEYGLDDGYYNQHAAFIDVDLDGDLDAYLLRNVIDDRDKNAPSEKRFINVHSTDQLLLQVDGKFVLPKEKYTLSARGYGLGVTATDFNKDGYPDIYVANDFLSDDLLYINVGVAKDGEWLGYRNMAPELLNHISYNAMGVDAADVNGDGFPEVVTLDMLPDTYERLRSMQGGVNHDKLSIATRQGYIPQFVRNSLQANQGLVNDRLLAFAEIGQQAGIAATDWSWAPLLVDLDNDADKDLLVTNGYGKDITDLDFTRYTQLKHQTFGSQDLVMKAMWAELQKLKHVSLPNHVFEQTGEFRFEEPTGRYDTGPSGISNGVATADFDNDGDLDVLINNINAPASLLENHSSTESAYLRVKLTGAYATQARIELTTSDQDQVVQSTFTNPTRGYLSSIDQVTHFGLGKRADLNDSASYKIHIFWPLERVYETTVTSLDTTVTIDYSQSHNSLKAAPEKLTTAKYEVEASPIQIGWKDTGRPDMRAQPLLANEIERQVVVELSPASNYVFIGGEDVVGTRLYDLLGEAPVLLALPEAIVEVTAACWVSATRLLVAHRSGATSLISIVNGEGTVVERSTPTIPGGASILRSADLDGDGDLDVVAVSRLAARSYPQANKVSLWRNDGQNWTLVTGASALSLANVGMVSDIVLADFNLDGYVDIALTGPFNETKVLSHTGLSIEYDEATAISESGLWNRLYVTDLDRDGRLDLVVGNQGLNTHLHASKAEPLLLNASDLDGNGSRDPLLAKVFRGADGVREPRVLQGADDLFSRVPSVRQHFGSYASLAGASYGDIVGAMRFPDSTLQVTQLASVVLLNKSSGWNVDLLPPLAQRAPVNVIAAVESDGDRRLSLFVGGNNHRTETLYGTQDASCGLLIQADEAGYLRAVSSAASGLCLEGDLRILKALPDGHILIGARGEKQHYINRITPEQQVFSQDDNPTIN